MHLIRYTIYIHIVDLR